MEKKKISELKKGEWFTLKPIDEPNEMQVYIRGDYDRQSKTYGANKYGDYNYERFFKGSKEVYTDFIF